jgi:acetylglutamate kinase
MSALVVKLGGHTLDSLAPNAQVLVDLANDVAALRSKGTEVVIVHGGGPQISQLLATVGVESRFHEGLRITDSTTMGYVAMALGQVNLRVVAALNQAGLPSIGLSGADGSVLHSTSLGTPWNRAGTAPKVQADLIETLWRDGFTVVLSPVALDADGELLNCNADTVAGAVAGAVGASSLVLLSDIDQLRAQLDDADSALASVTSAEVKAMIDSGAARDGMRPKMTAALDALDGGAYRIVMANGTRAHALRDALTNSIPTTEVVR